jgi:hypothetical protein
MSKTLTVKKGMKWKESMALPMVTNVDLLFGTSSFLSLRGRLELHDDCKEGWTYAWSDAGNDSEKIFQVEVVLTDDKKRVDEFRVWTPNGDTLSCLEMVLTFE